ncbi:MAG: D-glycero-alpha-D-manno-heptose-1,7-bisphosphate 7-phosphatase [Acidimicrobiia bacterium]
MTRAVFLDRDGTLNVDVGYLHRLEDLELFPYTADALRLLKRAGYLLVVVTNQSGVARGTIDPAFIQICHDEMRRRLQPAGADLDALYHCNHHPLGSVKEFAIDCRCRKPMPGMIEDAMRDHDIDPAQSWVVGDKWLDVNLGKAVGARSILVRTGWGEEQAQKRPAGQEVDAICDNLIHAVSVILGQSNPS